MKKLQTILNELIKVLNTKKELLNTILKNKKENDKKEFSQEQVLKGQEINNQIYNTKYMIEGSEKGIEEHKRLMKEANNYIDNKHISYEDFLTLCDIYNIKVAARTKGHLKNADACIKNGSYQLPKKMKASNTVLNLSEELYKVLLEDTEQKENDKINDLSGKDDFKEINKNNNFLKSTIQYNNSNIEVVDEPVTKDILKVELSKFDLILKYNYSRKEYYIQKKGNILEKLYKDIEMNSPKELIEEFLKMQSYFRKQEYIVENIMPKKAIDMTLDEFIKAHRQEHQEVCEIMENYFNALDRIEKRRIRNDYDDVHEYVYNKFIKHIKEEFQDVIKFDTMKNVNNIEDVKGIQENQTYMLFWYDTALEQECKSSYKGKYINKLVSEFLNDEYINNIRIINMYDHFNNNVVETKVVTEVPKMELQLLSSAADTKEVLKETNDYILFKNDSVYTLRYFDECIGHEKYNRNKDVKQSRVTKNYDSIKHLLQDHEVINNSLRIICNDDIEGHREYQEQHLQQYNFNTLNFSKKRVTDKMIEEYTKYFVHDDKTFMSVKPSAKGCYPSAYYEHVRKHDLLVDTDNKIILCTDKQ